MVPSLLSEDPFTTKNRFIRYSSFFWKFVGTYSAVTAAGSTEKDSAKKTVRKKAIDACVLTLEILYSIGLIGLQCFRLINSENFQTFTRNANYFSTVSSVVAVWFSCVCNRRTYYELTDLIDYNNNEWNFPSSFEWIGSWKPKSFQFLKVVIVFNFAVCSIFGFIFVLITSSIFLLTEKDEYYEKLVLLRSDVFFNSSVNAYTVAIGVVGNLIFSYLVVTLGGCLFLTMTSVLCYTVGRYEILHRKLSDIDYDTTDVQRVKRNICECIDRSDIKSDIPADSETK